MTSLSIIEKINLSSQLECVYIKQKYSHWFITLVYQALSLIASLYTLTRPYNLVTGTFLQTENKT